MEEDLKILKVKYLSNHWSDLTPIWNLSLQNLTKGYKGVKWRWTPMEDNLKWEMTSKYEKENISATTGRILLKFET